jgi:hypothetical protein
VFGAVERGGRLRARIIPDRKLPTLDKTVKLHVMSMSRSS